MTYGALGGLAIDVDDRTMRHARKNLAQFPSLEVRSQSIYETPETDTFDFDFSIRVVHDLADLNAAVARVVRALKPGMAPPLGVEQKHV